MKIYLITMLVFALGACGFLEYASQTSTDPEIIQMQAEFSGLQASYETLKGDYETVRTEYEGLAARLKEDGLSAETAKEIAQGMASAMDRMTRVAAVMSELKERSGRIQSTLEAKADADGVPWYYVAGSAVIALFTGGAMPTMNGIPILGRVLPKLAPLLKKAGLRNEEERRAHHLGQPSPSG